MALTLGHTCYGMTNDMVTSTPCLKTKSDRDESARPKEMKHDIRRGVVHRVEPAGRDVGQVAVLLLNDGKDLVEVQPHVGPGTVPPEVLLQAVGPLSVVHNLRQKCSSWGAKRDPTCGNCSQQP
jgi:hypothetical protein